MAVSFHAFSLVPCKLLELRVIIITSANIDNSGGGVSEQPTQIPWPLTPSVQNERNTALGYEQKKLEKENMYTDHGARVSVRD